MKKAIFILLLLIIRNEAFSQSTQISSPLNSTEQDFDVIEYAPFIEFKSLTKAINAYNDIRFVWKKKSEQSVFYFHLKELKVDSVFYNEKKISAEKKTLSDFEMDYYQVQKLAEDNSDSVI